MGSRQGSFTSQDGSFTQASPRWGPAQEAGYFAPMSVQYDPIPPHMRHPFYQTVASPERGAFLAAPPPQLLPQNSYLFEDHLQGAQDQRGVNSAPSMTVRRISSSLAAVSILSLLSQLVMMALAIFKNHEHIHATPFWLFIVCGGVSCLLSLGSLCWGGRSVFVSRLGFFISGIGSGAAGAFWFYMGKEGIGILLGGHAFLVIGAMLFGDSFFGPKRTGHNSTEDFTFGQPFLANEADLRIGQ